MQIPTSAWRISGNETVFRPRPGHPLFAFPDFPDREFQVAIPIQGIPGQIEVSIEQQHGYVPQFQRNQRKASTNVVIPQPAMIQICDHRSVNGTFSK